MNDSSDQAPQSDFAQQIIEGLRNAGDERAIIYQPEEFQLQFRDGDTDCGVLNLSNLYAEFSKLDPELHEKRISEIVRAALSHLKPIPEDFQDASYDLRPRLWSRSTFEMMKLKSRLEGNEVDSWPLEPIGDHLYLSLVFDLPESVRSLNDGDLNNWNISFWEAREVALKNLAEEDFVLASLGDVLYASNTGDSYDATRLILANLIEQLQIEGDPVAMVPNRDTLLITGSESEVGLTMMIEMAAKELQENPRPMLATLLSFRDGQWEDWELPIDHPSQEQYRRCVLGWRQFEYDNQKKILDAINEQELNDCFNANFTVISKDDQHLSYSVWAQGIVNSLPKTDIVAFVGESDSEVKSFATWESVVKHCGELMEEQEFYPSRFLVREFPPESLLAQLEQG
ncbi:DUF1444 family protein [bacterium]|nr:DUF1444 family protein [bacterium]